MSLARKLIACVACTFIAAPLSCAEAYREDAVKAAFLNRFTGYVEWPATAAENREFRIAVLGAPSIAGELQQLVGALPARNLPTRVASIASVTEARNADLLYVGAGYRGSLAKLVAEVGGRPVLIVSDHARGLDDGAAINLLTVDQRVRFEVSLTAAQRAGLKISSQLLAVAVRVRGSRAEEGGR